MSSFALRILEPVTLPCFIQLIGKLSNSTKIDQRHVSLFTFLRNNHFKIPLNSCTVLAK